MHTFQNLLMNKELIRANGESKNIQLQLDKNQNVLRNTAPERCLPSIVIIINRKKHKALCEMSRTHGKELCKYSEEQECPTHNVKNTVTLSELDNTPMTCVLET